MKRVSYIIVGIFLPSIIFADEAALEKCHKISTDYIRLLCYDRETGYKKIEADPKAKDRVEKADPTTSKQSGKQWRYSEEVSALDDRKDVWLSVFSKNTEGNSIGSPIRATLWIRCMENKTNVLIGFDRYTTDDQNVRYKFDNEPIDKQWMETMRGGDGIGIWSGSRSISFIRKMFDKERLVIAYNTYSAPVEFTFDISGLRARIPPLARECEWTP